MIDVDRNEGKITNFQKKHGRWRGTRVEFEVKEVSYVRSRYGPFNYLRMTAIANPHAHITFVEPDGTLTIFENAVSTVPDRPVPMLPHPWGIMADDLLTLAKRTRGRTAVTFLSGELSRVSKRKAEQACKLAGISTNKKPSELTWEDAERLVSAFKQMKFLAPSAEGLRPIGAENIMKGMQQVLAPEFIHAATRSPKVYRGGIPFLVEVGVAYGGGAGKRLAEEPSEEVGIELVRFANRVPLIFDQGGCAITTAVRSVDWRRYGVDPATSPLTLFINVVSAYVPYTSAGKQSIADEPEILAEVRAAIMEVARELRHFLHRKIRLRERQERAELFEKYLPIIAGKAADLAETEVPDVKPLLEKITGVGHED
jgi:DNA topoisomerase-6 subunit B